MKKGLVIVHTGDGKGKTTAALGLAFRALGHGKKVLVVQFIKGSWKYGELYSAEKFGGALDFKVMGRGFTFKSEDLEKDKEKAAEAWLVAEEAVKSDTYDMIILDEITYPINYGMISGDLVAQTLKDKPENLHIVLTGRNAPHMILDIADTVTEMTERKHHYKNGVTAQKGIEF